jgi:hypothetical protein
MRAFLASTALALQSVQGVDWLAAVQLSSAGLQKLLLVVHRWGWCSPAGSGFGCVLQQQQPCGS